MIQANELMIGDWVLAYEHPIQVEVIYNNRRIQANCIELCEDEFEPIPITAEILEKNFEKKTFYGIYDDYFDLYLREYSDSIYVATFHNCEMSFPDQSITLSFVHELQHFMNHCGIKKEIKL